MARTVNFDPKTSYGKIVKFNKKNPEEYETVGGLIRGKDEILKKLIELREREADRDGWGYYWKWVKRDASDTKQPAKRRKVKNK